MSLTSFTQAVHRHARDVLVDQDSHPSVGGGVEWGDLLFGQLGGVVEASHDVFARQRRVLGQQVIDCIAVRQHMDHLVDSNPRALYTRLPMADSRID